MRPRLAAGLAAGLSVLVLAGCSSAGSASSVSTTSPDAFQPVAPSAGPELPESTDPAGITGEDVALTEQEQRYVEAAGQDGVYPPAVLEVGHEACLRIANTARVDRSAAVEALADEEIPGAAKAIQYLCPEFEDLLDQAP